MLETHRVPTPDGRTLRVLDSGGDGPAVLYLHGTPATGRPYEPHVADARSRGLRFLAYDRPGYGGSTAHPNRVVADAAADVDAIADSLGIERLAVWGVSGGGPHALAVAALSRRAAAVASLASPAPFPAEGIDWFEGMGELNVEEFRLALEGRAALEPSTRRQAATFVASTPEQLAEELRTLLAPVDAAVLTGDVARWIHETIVEALSGSLDGWLDDDLAFARGWGFELDARRVPLLVWHGEHDRFVPVAHARWLAERLDGAEVRITADDGHLTLAHARVPDVHAWLAERLQP